eukprot:m51a1_g7775 putative u-box domain-containing protein 37 (602) ;mRNA; r:163235-167430
MQKPKEPPQPREPEAPAPAPAPAAAPAPAPAAVPAPVPVQVPQAQQQVAPVPPATRTWLSERLWEAASKGDTEAARKCLMKGADPNFPTPLHQAATRGSVECLSLLLQYGANINARTALHYAVVDKRPEAYLFLVTMGIDQSILNADGHTALQIASADFLKTIKAMQIPSKQKEPIIDMRNSEGPTSRVVFCLSSLDLAINKLAEAEDLAARKSDEAAQLATATADYATDLAATRKEIQELEARLAVQRKKELELDDCLRRTRAGADNANALAAEAHKSLMRVQQEVQEWERKRAYSEALLQKFTTCIYSRDLRMLGTEDVAELLREGYFDRSTVEAFVKNGIEGRHLLQLSDKHLVEQLGMQSLHKRCHFRHIVELVSSCGVVNVSRALLLDTARSLGDDGILVVAWGAAEVSEHLRERGVSESTRGILVNGGISGDVLIHLTEDNMHELGIANLGDCFELAARIKELHDRFFNALHARLVDRTVIRPRSAETSADQAAAAVAAAAGGTPASPGGSGAAQESAEERNAKQAPSEYICPITLEVMRDPVLAPDGFLYERGAITKWLQAHHTSPMTHVPMDPSKLIPCNTLRSAINDFLSHQ